MVKCVVISCKNDSRKHNKKNSNISFHRFPKSREVINAWAKAIKRPNWEPSIQSFICSVHFKPSCISETKSGLRKLDHDAIPELNLGNQVNNSVDVAQSININVDKCGQHRIHCAEPEAKVNLVEVVQPSTSSMNVPLILVREDYTVPQSDTLRKIKLKREILHLHEIAKRRRMRCNALYAQQNRLKKKIASLTNMLSQRREKEWISQEHNYIL